jgi:hypothetical protein
MRAIITQIDALPTSRALTYSRCGRGMWSQASPSILRHPVFPPRWGCRPVARFPCHQTEHGTAYNGYWCFSQRGTLRTEGGSSAKGHDDFDCGSAFAGNHGLAGQCAKPAARRCQHPCAQERNPDRHAGGVLRGNRLLRLRPRLDQRVLPPLLPMRTLLVRGGSAIVPECFEAASARRPLALT